MFTKKQIAKGATQLVVTSSVSKVIHDVIDENTDAESKTDEVQLWVGSFVLASLVTKHAWQHAEVTYDRVANFVDGFKKNTDATE